MGLLISSFQDVQDPKVLMVSDVQGMDQATEGGDDDIDQESQMLHLLQLTNEATRTREEHKDRSTQALSLMDIVLIHQRAVPPLLTQVMIIIPLFTWKAK